MIAEVPPLDLRLILVGFFALTTCIVLFLIVKDIISNSRGDRELDSLDDNNDNTQSQPKETDDKKNTTEVRPL